MSSFPPMGPALRRLADRTATHAAAWQSRLGHALRTRTAPSAPASGLPARLSAGLSAALSADLPARLTSDTGHRRAVTAVGAATVILSGALLVAAPGNAAAQTVLPTTPGSSAFTAPQSAAPAPAAVQVAGPSAYRMPHQHGSAQQYVAVAANLLTAAPAEAPATSADHAQPAGQEPAPAAEPAAPAAEPAPAPEAAPAPAPEPAPAPAPEPAPAPPRAEWSAPVPGAPTSNPYGVVNPEYAAGYHTGVDFAVAPGTPLLAVGDATVVSAGWAGAYGKEVVLRLADGHFAEYAHMSSISVSAGERVEAGERIGSSGNTGNSTGPHLHFEIRNKNHYGSVINPIAFLSARGVTSF
ncbi:M23 family metallopeptidase [Kitasatospora sp. NPDC004240]